MLEISGLVGRTARLTTYQASSMHAGQGGIDVSGTSMIQLVVIGLQLTRERKHREILDNSQKMEDALGGSPS